MKINNLEWLKDQAIIVETTKKDLERYIKIVYLTRQ